MRAPDMCTSFHCSGPPQDYCPRCSHAIFFGQGTDAYGTLWRWEFHVYHGPRFVDEHGDVLDDQPVEEDHPAWDPFDAWLAKEGL